MTNQKFYMIYIPKFGLYTGGTNNYARFNKLGTAVGKLYKSKKIAIHKAENLKYIYHDYKIYEVIVSYDENKPE